MGPNGVAPTSACARPIEGHNASTASKTQNLTLRPSQAGHGAQLLPKPAENHLITTGNRAGNFAARGRIGEVAHGPDWTGKYFFVRLGVYKPFGPAALLRRRAGRAH